MNSGLFCWFPEVAKLINHHFSGQTGPFPLMSNISYAHYLNSLIFCGMDRNVVCWMSVDNVSWIWINFPRSGLRGALL